MAKPTAFPTSRTYLPDFYFAVARNELDGVSHVHKFGFNESVGTTFEAVWSQTGAYTYIPTATILTISSASTADTSAGTGAQTINIQGLDGDYNEVSEDVILNGQTAVNTVNLYIRVFRIVVLTVGSGGTNAGKIYAGTGTVTTGVPANKYGIVEIGYAQTLMAIYTIPDGFTGYLYSFDATSAISKRMTLRMMVTDNGTAFAVKDVMDITDDHVNHEWKFPLEIAERSDIEVQAKAVGGGGVASVNFQVLLVKN